MKPIGPVWVGQVGRSARIDSCKIYVISDGRSKIEVRASAAGNPKDVIRALFHWSMDTLREMEKG